MDERTHIWGDFEWDTAKADANLKKHSVTFEEAATTFRDDLSAVFSDSLDPARLILIGTSARLRVLLVVHEERRDRVRIISARLATRNERRRYENG